MVGQRVLTNSFDPNIIEKSERDAKDILKVHVRRPVEG